MRRYFITGANRGIGLEMARQLLVAGERLFAGARQPDHADDLHALEREYGDRLTIVQIDVTDPESIQAARDIVADHVTALDVVVNNAAILNRGEKIENFEAGIFNRTFAVNVTGPALVTRYFLSLLMDGDEPQVVNISSGLGSLEKKASGGTYSYSASKAALNMLTKAMSFELEPMGIMTVVMHPGWVQTDMGGDRARLTPQLSVQGILEVINGLTLADTGTFLQFDGQTLPW